MGSWLAAFACASSALWAPPPADVVREAARQAVADRSFQRDLPGPSSRPRDEEPPPFSGEGSSSSRRGRGGVGSLAPLANGLLWATAAAVVVVAAVWVAKEWGARTRRFEPAPVPGASPAAPAATGPGPASLAEALAREGRFAEAVHALLLDSLHALGARANASRPSLTSREVLSGAAAALSAPAVEALEDLVLAVEASRFAVRPAGAREWEAARAAHARFLAAAAAPAAGAAA
jgi:hypothetical protein